MGNPFTFLPLSSVFSPTQLIYHKESSFLARDQLSDPSEPELFSWDADGNAVDDSNNLNARLTLNSDQQKENVDPRCQNTSQSSYECSKMLVEVAGNINPEPAFVNSSLSSPKEKHVAEPCSECGKSVEEQRSVNTSEANLGGLGNIDQNYWDSLIADASDLLIFQSPNAEPYNESVHPATTFHRNGMIENSAKKANKDINTSSQKKRRRKLEQGGNGKSCKGCNCKNSECLKLYCECFAAGTFCWEPCACTGCFNKPIHAGTVLAKRKEIESRNPDAFAPKVIRRSNAPSEIGDDFANTPAFDRHKKGCNCKKSGCRKKYCECYQGEVGCSTNCRCEGCKNTFGRRDGSSTSCTDPVWVEEENETAQKAALERSFHKAAMHQCMDSAPPATPLGTARQPYHSFSKNEMPHFLQGVSHSPIGGINISSPNKKRVFRDISNLRR